MSITRDADDFVCVCDGRAGEGGVQISSNAIQFGAVHSSLTRD